MKFLLLVCALLVAGSTAELLVADATAETQNVAPTQPNIVVEWILHSIRVLSDWIVFRGYDPILLDIFYFDETIMDNVIHARGFVENLNVTGLSTLYASYVNFNPILGRLDCDLRMEEVCMSFDRYFLDFAIGLEGGLGELSGSACVRGIRVNIDALIRLDPGPRVYIFNINSDFSFEEIKGTFIASWRDRFNPVVIDVTDRVNNFVNVLIHEFFETNRSVIGTLLAQAIKRIANRWWWP